MNLIKDENVRCICIANAPHILMLILLPQGKKLQSQNLW
jgi:hypothetical protein